MAWKAAGGPVRDARPEAAGGTSVFFLPSCLPAGYAA